MKTRRFRLTKTAKILIMLLLITMIGGGVYYGISSGIIRTETEKINRLKKMQK